jgi:hypothetical protein
LKSSADAKERLAVLKQVIQQLMMLEYLPSTVEKEPCYADKELFERLATELGEYPIKDIALKLLKSIQTVSQQGRVGVGCRLLSEVIFLAINNELEFSFSLGIKFLEDIVGDLDSFYKKNKSWPDETTVNNVIEKRAEKVGLSLCIQTHALSKKLPPSTAAKRFRAMAGSSIFTDSNPGIPAGGKPAEAGQWYHEIISIIVNTMVEMGMLNDDWNEAKAQCLLVEICCEASLSSLAQSRINSVASETEKAMGFTLDLPEHFIPSVLYEERGNWIYTVMCRAFMQPLSKKNNGAVDFRMTTKHIAELLIPLVTEALKKRDAYQDQASSSTAVVRAIHYRLLTHFLEVEKIANTRCTYSVRPAQKPYKEPICFASNIKLFLQLLLIIMPKPTTTPEQWQKFNDKLKIYNTNEMSKANVSLEEFRQALGTVSDNAMAPEQVAYKLVTTLMRWREINLFNPASETETAGKEATIEHVLEHIRHRFI